MLEKDCVANYHIIEQTSQNQNLVIGLCFGSAIAAPYIYGNQFFKNMLKLSKSCNHEMIVRPRFPATNVKIDPNVFDKLKDIQANLPEHFKLVLTRGYENPNSLLGATRKILRFIGKTIFLILYPSRTLEIPEIFLPNGHDQDGKHVDISINIQSKTLNLLPFGVFTSPKIIQKMEKDYHEIILLIENKILAKGGRFHSNRLERLQMHVDFVE